MGDLHVLPGPGEAAGVAAEYVAALSRQCAQSSGRFSIALSGGKTPALLYRALASPSLADRVPFDLWEVFWGDERCVPADHPDSNYRLARATLLDRVHVPSGQVHRIRGDLAPEDAARHYERELTDYFAPSHPALDLVLLGIGDDGHTASLFPATDALNARDRLVAANWVPHLRAHRITLTLPLINASAAVAFLITGPEKAAALRSVLQPDGVAPPLPAALVRPASGTVKWFLTEDAAACLDGMPHAC